MRRRSFLTTGGSIWLVLIAGCGDAGETPAETDTQDGPTGTTVRDQPTDGGIDEPTDGTETTVADGQTTVDGDRSTTTTDGTQLDTTFGDVFSFVDAFAVDAEFTDPESGVSGTMTARYNGGNSYQRMEVDGTEETFEIYAIDDDRYLVIDGQSCFRNPGASMTPDADVEGDAETYDGHPDPDVRPTGRTQIDGERVYVFEATIEDNEETVRLYITEETGD